MAQQPVLTYADDSASQVNMSQLEPADSAMEVGPEMSKQSSMTMERDQLNHELEEQIIEHKENAQKYYRVERETLTINTLENQFFKYSVFYLLNK